ncbi:MAG: exodeoxyribonuclease VII large subunit [Limisphaerales bacterium]
MPRPATSQWEFGDLFSGARPAEPAAPAPAARTLFSVTEITRQVKGLLEGRFGDVWITGEITNLRSQPSGHAYFTLKDAAAQLACVLFRGVTGVARGLLQDGACVNLGGELTVYEARGQYQLLVRAVEARGEGALMAAFERLKRRLEAEGLFRPERKRPLPRFPRCVGLVTSPAGAALRDVLSVVRRRHPGLELILAPCRVQGAGAAEEIAAAIRRLNAYAVAEREMEEEARTGKGAEGRFGGGSISFSPSPLFPRSTSIPEAILVTRGGGSLEDLWAFNEETVARAIAESALPVVSAVGHEIDFTISDFTADLRAATPSAAAELLTAGYVAARGTLADDVTRLRRAMAGRLAALTRDVGGPTQRLERRHPRRQLAERAQRLDEARERLARATAGGLRGRRVSAGEFARRLARLRPGLRLAKLRDELTRRLGEFNPLAARGVAARRERLAVAEARLRLLSPDAVLARGYSITLEADSGRVLRDAREVPAGSNLRTRLARGEVRSRAE